MITLVRYSLLVTLLSSVQAACPDASWKEWNGHCYSLTSAPMSWHGLRGYCKTPFRQADLVSIASKAENDFIQTSFARGRRIWLGMRSNQENHRWVDDKPVTFINFAASVSTSVADDVAQMVGDTGLWELTSSFAGHTLYGVCKMASCSCRSGWRLWNGHCYLAQQNELGWVEARQHCQKLDPTSDLASINSAEQETYMFNLAGGRFPSWIGLHDRIQENVFQWGNNYSHAYSKWHVGEPNGVSHREDCVGIISDNTWVDYGCHSTVIGKSFVCQQAMCGEMYPIDEEQTRLGYLRVWRPQDGVRCPVGWSRSGSRCFSKPTAADTFTGVQHRCRQMHSGSSIASINSLEDNDKAYLAATSLPVFVYTDGKFGVWQSGSGGEGCASLQATGLWSGCGSSSQPGVCQVPACTPVCPTGWSLFRGYCYRVDDTRRKAVDAEAECRAAGGSLASIRTQDENDFIFTLTFPASRLTEIQNDGTMRYALIGAERANKSADWQWSDCSDWTISRWSGRDGHGPTEIDDLCAVMVFDGRWLGAINCATLEFRSVCKLDPCKQQFGPLHRPFCPGEEPTTPAPTTTTTTTTPAPTTTTTKATTTTTTTKATTTTTKATTTTTTTPAPSIISSSSSSSSSYSSSSNTTSYTSSGGTIITSSVISSSSGTSTLSPCPEDGRQWSDEGEFCLTVVRAGPAAFRPAFVACESMTQGRFQVTVPALRTFKEREPLLRLAAGSDVWMGLTRRWTGTWYWHDRRRADILVWQTLPTEETRCVALDARTAGLKARNCADPLPYFCQARRLF